MGANYDGRHRFIKSPAYTVSGSPADPGGTGLGTSMDGILYLKTTNSQAQWFHRNTSKIYQVTPTLLTGTVAVPTTSYVTVVAVPANVFGEIFMYTTALGEVSCQTGYFRSNGTTVESWAVSFFKQSGTSATIALKFANGSQASGLNIRARRGDAASATWNYRITYRAL